MIVIREIDKSSVIPNTDLCTLVLPAVKGPIKEPTIIGNWKRRKYQYLSHRRKLQYMKDWRAGLVQQREFCKVFGKPEDSGCWSPEVTDRQLLYAVRAEVA